MTMKFTLDGEPFELTADLVRSRIEHHHPEPIREYWVEIDGARWPVKQVISLATGVMNRQRFQSQSSRSWLARLGFPVGKGSRITSLDRRSTNAAPSPPGRGEGPTESRDVVLIGCVKTKLDHGAPAKDLYISDYFQKMRTYAEGAGVPWFILSAEHGLLSPEEWVEPYEKYLPDTSAEYRREWGAKVVAQLADAVGPLDEVVVDIHAGAAYVASIEPALLPLGGVIVNQLEGLSFGRRLSWYGGRESSTSPDVKRIGDELQDRSLARPLHDLVASNGAGLRTPGLYSWWVDQQGARDLSEGLGYEVREGLIYAGLAGATRTGGGESSNTLWGRIATMHLGKRQDLSTLRRSIGSILASRFGWATIDEGLLTTWMYEHLRVAAIPVIDASTLNALESEMLADLDPPLNLAKVERTPLRVQLSVLRKRYAGTRP